MRMGFWIPVALNNHSYSFDFRDSRYLFQRLDHARPTSKEVKTCVNVGVECDAVHRTESRLRAKASHTEMIWTKNACPKRGP